MKNFKKLKIWENGMEVVEIVYRTSGQFPLEEKFGLTSQIRRSAESIPSNISEGCSRKSDKDKARFIEIAIGSAYETETQLLIAKRLKFIDESECNIILDKLDSLQGSMFKFHSTLIDSGKIKTRVLIGLCILATIVLASGYRLPAAS